jgi:ACR3 family arsenite efflux pump ArsB
VDGCSAPDIFRGGVPCIVFQGRKIGADFEKTEIISFAAASNNVGPAIAVDEAILDISSGAAFTDLIGPLGESPVLIDLVNVALLMSGMAPGSRRRESL